MITAIIIIIVAIVVIKVLGPILVDVFSWAIALLEIPFGLLFGFIAFIFEALLFVGALWLIVTIFGL